MLTDTPPFPRNAGIPMECGELRGAREAGLANGAPAEVLLPAGKGAVKRCGCWSSISAVSLTVALVQLALVVLRLGGGGRPGVPTSSRVGV